MLRDMAHVRELSSRYNVAEDDVLIIALNAMGLSTTLPYPRARFHYRHFSRKDDPLFLILACGNRKSPFTHKGDVIRFQDHNIGRIEGIENDDVVQAYSRNNGRNITLNSNARSMCTGCVFCYNVLENVSDPNLSTGIDLLRFFEFYCADKGWEDLRSVEKITVSTGCFNHEAKAIQHMERIRSAASEFGFSGELHLLSSVIRTKEGLKRAGDIGPFHLTLTIECFSKRDEILKRSKAVFFFQQMLDALEFAKENSVKADYCYIVGLDDLETMIGHLSELAPLTSTFPRLQIFQAHNEFMEHYRSYDATDMNYYLSARTRIEDIFRASSLRPKSWENYRPLWYYEFGGTPLNSVRV